MSQLAGALELQIFAGVARIQEDMQKIRGVVDSGMSGVASAANIAKSAFAALGVTLSVNAFARMIQGSIDAQDELLKMSQRVGVSVETLAGLEFAANLSGTSLTNVEKALKTVSQQLIDADRGLKTAKDNFALLGISVYDTNGRLKESDAVMIEVADRFAEMEDGTVKTAAATKLFGRAGLELIPMLNEGSAGLAELIAEGQRYNPVTQESARQAEIFNDNMDRFKSIVGEAAVSITNRLLPGLVALTEKLLGLDHPLDDISESLRNMTGDDLQHLLDQSNQMIDVLSQNVIRLTTELAYMQAGTIRDNQKIAETIAELNDAERGLEQSLEDRKNIQAQVNAVTAQNVAVSEDSGQANEDLAKEIAKATEEMLKQRDAVYDVIGALQDEIVSFGLSERENYIWTQQKKAGNLVSLEERLTIQALSGAIYDEKEARELATDAAEEQARAVEQAAEQRGRAEEEAARRAQENWQRTHEYLTNTFIDIFNNGKNAFDNIARAFKSMIERMIAEWLASGVMNLFGIGGGSGGSSSTGVLNSIFGGGGSSASDPMSTISNIASTAGGIGNLASVAGSIGTIASTWGTTAGWVAPSMANAATLSAAGGTAAAGGGIMSGLGSTISGIGSTVWGGLQSLGSGAMNLISAIPGWGWVIGGLAAAAALLDKESTPSHNAGFLTSVPPSLVGSAEVFEAAEFASGVDVYGWTRRQPKETAIEVISAFATVDSLLTTLLRNAGMVVALTGFDFPGYNEKGLSYGGGVFWGSAGEDGLPGTDLDIQLNNYARRLVEVVALKNGIGSDVVSSVLSGASSVDEIVQRVSQAVSIDGSHASGLGYVPYDGYVAMLHRGERVETASQRIDGNNAVNELRSLKSLFNELVMEVRSLRNINDKWDGEGLPDTRPV